MYRSFTTKWFQLRTVSFQESSIAKTVNDSQHQANRMYKLDPAQWYRPSGAAWRCTREIVYFYYNITLNSPTHFGPQRESDHSIARSKYDGTRAETRFVLPAKRTSPFKTAGVSVQSTAGSRVVRISGQQLYRPCSDVQCKAAGYPLHSHLSISLLLPCVTVCHQPPNAL